MSLCLLVSPLFLLLSLFDLILPSLKHIVLFDHLHRRKDLLGVQVLDLPLQVAILFGQHFDLHLMFHQEFLVFLQTLLCVFRGASALGRFSITRGFGCWVRSSCLHLFLSELHSVSSSLEQKVSQICCTLDHSGLDIVVRNLHELGDELLEEHSYDIPIILHSLEVCPVLVKHLDGMVGLMQKLLETVDGLFII